MDCEAFMGSPAAGAGTRASRSRQRESIATTIYARVPHLPRRACSRALAVGVRWCACPGSRLRALHLREHSGTDAGVAASGSREMLKIYGWKRSRAVRCMWVMEEL